MSYCKNYGVHHDETDLIAELLLVKQGFPEQALLSGWLALTCPEKQRFFPRLEPPEPVIDTILNSLISFLINIALPSLNHKQGLPLPPLAKRQALQLLSSRFPGAHNRSLSSGDYQFRTSTPWNRVHLTPQLESYSSPSHSLALRIAHSVQDSFRPVRSLCSLSLVFLLIKEICCHVLTLPRTL